MVLNSPNQNIDIEADAPNKIEPFIARGKLGILSRVAGIVKMHTAQICGKYRPLLSACLCQTMVAYHFACSWHTPVFVGDFPMPHTIDHCERARWTIISPLQKGIFSIIDPNNCNYCFWSLSTSGKSALSLHTCIYHTDRSHSPAWITALHQTSWASSWQACKLIIDDQLILNQLIAFTGCLENRPGKP